MRDVFVSTVVKGLAAVTLAGVAMFGALSPAQADAFDNANAYYSQKYGVPDFKFTKSEFGNTNLGRVLHLGVEVLVETFWGATVVYNPKTDTVYVWGSIGGYSEPENVKQYSADSTCFGTYGMEVSIGGVATCIPGSSVGSASTVPQPVLLGVIGAKDRSCTFDAGKDGLDVHTC